MIIHICSILLILKTKHDQLLKRIHEATSKIRVRGHNPHKETNEEKMTHTLSNEAIRSPYSQ